MSTDTGAKPAKRYGLTVSVDGITSYALDFAHEEHTGEGGWPQAIRRKGIWTEVLSKRRTRAIVLHHDDDGTETTVATAEAYCSPDDSFDKEVGRQVALYEVLKALPKEVGRKVHLGKKLLHAYCTRPNALPWVINAEGRIDYIRLRWARTKRAQLKDGIAQFRALSAQQPLKEIPTGEQV